MKTKLKITKITPSNGGKTSVLTMTAGIDLFGIKDAKTVTYYIGNLSNVPKELLNTEVEEDLSKFWHVKRRYMMTNGAEKVFMMLTWLHDKVRHPERPADDAEWTEDEMAAARAQA